MAAIEQPGLPSRGAHRNPGNGRCAMERVAHLAGEPHGDRPACVSPLITMYLIALNDTLDDHQRQRLRSYLRRCIGTAGDQRDCQPARRCLDWLARSATPAFLGLIAPHSPPPRRCSRCRPSLGTTPSPPPSTSSPTPSSRAGPHRRRMAPGGPPGSTREARPRNGPRRPCVRLLPTRPGAAGELRPGAPDTTPWRTPSRRLWSARSTARLATSRCAR
jgi:hypothetical protein